MKLTPEEYKRGVICWEGEIPAGCSTYLRTRTSDIDPALGETTAWSDVLTDPAGSKVTSPPGRYKQVSAGSDPSWTGPAPKLHRIRWEAEDYTAIWTASDEGFDQSIPLALTTDFGKFYRLVLGMKNLDWPNDTVVLAPGLRLRLLHGELSGHKVSAFDRWSISEDDQTVRLEGGRLEEASVSGTLVEILAEAHSLEEAKDRCHSVVGLLAFVLGDQVIGEVLFSDEYESNSKEERGYVEIPIRTMTPRVASNGEVAGIDLMLPSVLGASRGHKARSIALRWYYRGLASGTAEDRFFSFFIGIEALVTGFIAEHGLPEPSVARREKLDRFLASSARDDPDLQTLIRERVSRPTLREMFEEYRVQRGLDNEALDVFTRINRLRGEAFHGEATQIDNQEAFGARRLLETLLKSELGIVGRIPGQEGPRVFSLKAIWGPKVQNT